VGDKLVSRDPQRGHVVTPLDATTSDDVHDARLAIELGAAELVGDRLSAAQIAQLRELAAATGSHVRDGRFGDVEAFIDASHAFHRFLVDATGVRSLVEAYEQLSLPDLMAQALPNETDTDPHLITDHFDLVDALERADLPAVRRVLTTHNERAKTTQRAGIERRGGRL
jgi:benzoate/toluate 1,2-dioxygenase reductase subunit